MLGHTEPNKSENDAGKQCQIRCSYRLGQGDTARLKVVSRQGCVADALFRFEL